MTGQDQSFFERDPQAVPPAIRAEGITADRGEPPSNVWVSSKLCFRLIPDRVLEYGDPIDDGNGLTDVIAAVLFHPEKLPSWISDQRVLEAIRPNITPLQVFWLSFRNTGDGWRYLAPATIGFVGSKTHILSFN